MVVDVLFHCRHHRLRVHGLQTNRGCRAKGWTRNVLTSIRALSSCRGIRRPYESNWLNDRHVHRRSSMKEGNEPSDIFTDGRGTIESQEHVRLQQVLRTCHFDIGTGSRDATPSTKRIREDDECGSITDHSSCNALMASSIRMRSVTMYVPHRPVSL